MPIAGTCVSLPMKCQLELKSSTRIASLCCAVRIRIGWDDSGRSVQSPPGVECVGSGGPGGTTIHDVRPKLFRSVYGDIEPQCVRLFPSIKCVGRCFAFLRR